MIKIIAEVGINHDGVLKNSLGDSAGVIGAALLGRDLVF